MNAHGQTKKIKSCINARKLTVCKKKNFKRQSKRSGLEFREKAMSLSCSWAANALGTITKVSWPLSYRQKTTSLLYSSCIRQTSSIYIWKPTMAVSLGQFDPTRRTFVTNHNITNNICTYDKPSPCLLNTCVKRALWKRAPTVKILISTGHSLEMLRPSLHFLTTSGKGENTCHTFTVPQGVGGLIIV